MIEVGLPIFLRIMSALVLFWSALHFLGTWITFRIVNFILLIALGVYLYRMHLAAWIREQIEKRDNKLAALLCQKKLLGEQVKEVEQQAAVQDKKIQGVHARIRQWQARFEQYKTEAKQTRELSTEQLVTRRKNQLQALRKKKYNEFIMPLVLKETREQLEHNFKNKEFGKAYLAKIIASLQGDKI